MRIPIPLLIVPWWFAGCALHQSDRVLIEQARQAGEIAHNDPLASPETKQAGRDVALNMVRLEDQHGKPDGQVVYTHENAANARQGHADDYAHPPAIGFLAGLVEAATPIGGVLVSALTLGYGIVQRLKAQKATTAHESTLHGIEDAMGAVPPESKAVLEDKLTRQHERDGVGGFVHDKLVSLGYAKKG